MPDFRRAFPVESDGPDRVEITWKGSFFYPESAIQVYLDGRLLGTIPDRTALRAGRIFTLPEGQEMHVRLDSNTLVVLLGNRSLGDLEHPRKELRGTAAMFAWVAGLDLLLLVTQWFFGRLPASQASGIPWTVAGLIGMAAVYALFYSLARQGRWEAFLLGGVLIIPNAWLLARAIGEIGLGLILISLVVGVNALRAARTAHALVHAG